MRTKVGTKALTEIALRRKINVIVRNAVTKPQPFVPRNAVRGLSMWLVALKLSDSEKMVASRLLKSILVEYVRRLRWVGEEVEQEVFNRYGG